MVNCVRLPSQEGIWLVNLSEAMLKILSWVRFAKKDGISVSKLIPLKEKISSLPNFSSQDKDKEEGFKLLIKQ